MQSGDEVLPFGRTLEAELAGYGSVRYAAFTDGNDVTKAILSCAAAFALLIVGVIFFPYFYNYKLHPLSKFADSFAAGDSCRNLESEIDSYVASHPGSEGGRSNSGVSRILWPVPDPREGYILFLRDVSLFDEPQFEAACFYKSEAVADLGYIAD